MSEESRPPLIQSEPWCSPGQIRPWIVLAMRAAAMDDGEAMDMLCTSAMAPRFYVYGEYPPSVTLSINARGLVYAIRPREREMTERERSLLQAIFDDPQFKETVEFAKKRFRIEKTKLETQPKRRKARVKT